MMLKRRRNKFGLDFNRYTNRVCFNTDPGAGGAGGGGAGGAPAEGGTPPAAATPPADNGGTPPADNGGTPPAAAADDWRKDWAPELRDDPSLKDIKDPQSLAKAFIDTKKMVGAKPLKVPGADATDEERAAFDAQYREAMVPKDAAGYALAKPEGLTPEMEELFNDEGLGQFASFAHEIGLTKAQVDKLIGFDKTRAESMLNVAGEASAARETAFMADFTKVHGANANKVLDQAGALIDATGRSEDAKIIGGASQAVRAAVANVLNEVHKQYIGEGKLPGQGGGGGAAKSLSELKTDLKAVIAKPEYRDQFHADHKATIDQANSISQQISLLQKGGAK